jgi:hypothetical protein
MSGVRLRAHGLDPEVSGGAATPLFALPAASGGDPANAPTIALVFRDAGTSGGVPSDAKAKIMAAVGREVPGATFAARPDAFELSASDGGTFLLRGPDARVRNRIESAAKVPEVLLDHLRQQRLLALRGNHATYADHDALRVTLRPARVQPGCADGKWDQAEVGAAQAIPLCHRWFVRVDLAPDSVPLHLAAVVLSSDGSSYVLAAPQSAVQGGHDFAGDVFAAGPPVEVYDHLLVMGSSKPIDMKALLESAEVPPDVQFTLSATSFEVVANDGFLASAGEGREYTVRNFDIRPYLPDDPASPLARFLDTADKLAKASRADGYPYKQHDWSKPTDAANLALGIDCSRSIWYGFTRSKLTYNRDDRFLTTADMAAPDSRMADQFDRCPLDGSFELGDLLVYRSATRGDGHVVAVIDVEKRIAWGSHGWDGTPNVEPAFEADTGVEYQKIKMKKDWQKWDRADMQLVACWRYRKFAEQHASARASGGSAILGERCGC